MILTHYSELGIVKPFGTRDQLHPSFKPIGLWVTVDGEDDWKNWCLSERFCVEQLRYKHEVRLNHDARLLHLSRSEQIIAFTRRYRSDDEVNQIVRGTLHIDWPRVGEEYEGILIAPYQWSLRLNNNVNWYYAWDCASGCIWEPTAVESMVCVEEKDHTA